jgi:peroxiredoxin
VGAKFPLLSDPDLSVIRAYGVEDPTAVEVVLEALDRVTVRPE